MAERYAGLAGASVTVVDGLVCLDLSYPETRRVDRYRFDPAAAVDLADELLAAVDEVDGG